jgi:hypothetical protein
MKNDSIDIQPHPLGILKHGTQLLVRGGRLLQAALQLHCNGARVCCAALLQCAPKHLELQPIPGLASKKLLPHVLPLLRTCLQGACQRAPSAYSNCIRRILLQGSLNLPLMPCCHLRALKSGEQHHTMPSIEKQCSDSATSAHRAQAAYPLLGCL